MEFADFLVCPLCGTTLTRVGKSLFCGGSRRHCYDIAASGYVNLLPPGKGKNAHTGDDGDMIAARVAFLSTGLYDCISDNASALAGEYLPKGRDAFRLLDAGSGEGYHTCRIARRIAESTGIPVQMVGIDASKKGAAAGAKLAGRTTNAENKSDSVSFAAGNIFALPVKDASLDGMCSLFAPIPAAEAARTLKEDGILVVAASAARHLWEMRTLLYDDPREGNEEVAPPEGFILAEKRTVREKIRIPDGKTLINLFTMTPFYYRTPKNGRERLYATESLDVSVMVDLYVFVKSRKNGEG